MLQNLFFRKSKYWIKYIILYILGFATAVFIGTIMNIYDPPPNKNQRTLLNNWQLYEENEGLYIKLKDVHNAPWLINIQHMHQSNDFDRIILTKNKDTVFEYLDIGANIDIGGLRVNLNPNSLTPIASYGWTGSSMSSYVWKDINFDSMFDERFGPGGYEILIDDKWVRAKRPDMKVPKVKTSQGDYEFDFTKGQWIPVKKL